MIELAESLSLSTRSLLSISQLTMSLLRFLPIKLLVIFLVFGIEGNKLTICSRFRACAVIRSVYPIETPSPSINNNLAGGSGDNIETEGSGEGSGEDSAEKIHVYDEFFPLANIVDDLPVYDTSVDPANMSFHQLCSCPENRTCPKEGSQTMHLDASIQLVFCNRITGLFPLECTGKRAIIRLIGRLDPNHPERMVEFEDTRVFCSCSQRRYKKQQRVEAWTGGLLHAFRYQCG